MISFELSDEQKAIQKVAHEFAEKEIRPVAAEYDEEEKYPEHFITTAFKAGMTYLYVPEEYGGQGMDFLTACIVGEEIAWGCCGFATILGANNLGTTPLLVAGSEEQKKKYLGDLTSRPSLAAMALTEPEVGSDAAGVKTTAVLKGDEYVINGTKCFISNGGMADLTTVFGCVVIHESQIVIHIQEVDIPFNMVPVIAAGVVDIVKESERQTIAALVHIQFALVRFRRRAIHLMIGI